MPQNQDFIITCKTNMALSQNANKNLVWSRYFWYTLIGDDYFRFTKANSGSISWCMGLVVSYQYYKVTYQAFWEEIQRISKGILSVGIKKVTGWAGSRAWSSGVVKIFHLSKSKNLWTITMTSKTSRWLASLMINMVKQWWPVIKDGATVTPEELAD